MSRAVPIDINHREAKEVIRIAFAMDERPDGYGPIEYNELRGLMVQLAAWVETRYGRLKFPSADGSQPANNVVAHQCFRTDPDWLCWWGQDTHDDGAKYRVRFRSRPTLAMGFRDGVTFCNRAGLWPAAETARLHTWAEQMRARHFFGAPVERYEKAMRAALAEVRKGLGVPPEGNEKTREPLREHVIREALGLDAAAVSGNEAALTETDRKLANIQRIGRAVDSLHDDITRAAPDEVNRASIALGSGPIAIGIGRQIEDLIEATRKGAGIPAEQSKGGPRPLSEAFVTGWIRWRANWRAFADTGRLDLVGGGVDTTISAYDREFREWYARLGDFGITPSQPLPAKPDGSGGSRLHLAGIALAIGAVVGGAALALHRSASKPPTPTEPSV